ncbi:MAG: hypothetical protein ACRC6A_05345 [Fusobacteriaceae bacterium]
MKSKYINFLLNENEINKIAKEVGLCTRIRKFTPMELLKMAVFSSNNIAKDILSDISHNIFETSDISVSCEALNKRLNSKFVKFLKAIFSKLLDMGLNIENSDKTTKNDFKFLPRLKKILRKNDLVLNLKRFVILWTVVRQKR